MLTDIACSHLLKLLLASVVGKGAKARSDDSGGVLDAIASGFRNERKIGIYPIVIKPNKSTGD
jgi:hypothetical protein